MGEIFHWNCPACFFSAAAYSKETLQISVDNHQKEHEEARDGGS